MITTTIEVRKNEFSKYARRIRPQIAEALNQSAHELVRVARPLTPVETGRLRDNVEIEAASPRNLGVDVTWRQPYAGFVHNGTRYMAARPFARQAADQIRNRHLARMKQAVGEVA